MNNATEVDLAIARSLKIMLALIAARAEARAARTDAVCN